MKPCGASPLGLAVLLAFTAAYDESQCASRQGTCQLTSLSCDGGSYVTGLCGGSSGRRCCIQGCSKMQKDLACELFNSDSIKAARRHAPIRTDNAYAYNNLRDMCHGKQASRSSGYCPDKICYAPGGTVCLHITLLQYLKALKDNGPVIILELAGGCHDCDSRHYQGLAVDLQTGSRRSEYRRLCRVNGTTDHVASHVHCQFREE